MKYCKNCNQIVQPTKKFSITWFLINCCWIIGGGVYLLYFILMKKKICPMCHDVNFEHHDTKLGDDELHQLTRSEISCQNTHETNLRAKDRLAKVRKDLAQARFHPMNYEELKAYGRAEREKRKFEKKENLERLISKNKEEAL